MHALPDLAALLRNALAEDIGNGDVTTLATIPAGAQANFVLRAREEMVVAGLVFLPELFAMVQPDDLAERVSIKLHVQDGDKVLAGAVLAALSGSARALLMGERTALNLVQQLSGVATLTRKYVESVTGTGAVIRDTRKTIPGLRAAQKYAVRCGGGQNHRMGLYDAVLIKDNHIAVAGSITAAVRAARRETLPIEVECDTLDQLVEALEAGVDTVLLDNMSNDQLREAVKRVQAYNHSHFPLQAKDRSSIKTEASGNVSLETVRGIAEAGVDYISVGKLTHSACAVDVGLDDA